MKTCPNCGTSSMHDLGLVCPSCGADLQNLTGISEDELSAKASQVQVSTGDIGQEYEVIGPVYFNITNKGLFSSQFKRLEKIYRDRIADLKKSGQSVRNEYGFGDLVLALGLGEWSAGHNLFDKAFFIAIEEIKRRAALLEADAILFMRQDIDLDTTGFQYFYLQMYGTAVKLLDHGNSQE